MKEGPIEKYKYLENALPGFFMLASIVFSLLIWISLLLFRGQFWRADQRLTEVQTQLIGNPLVAVIVPARNEAELIGSSLQSLLNQDYPGALQVILVDDQSSDETAGIAQQTAAALNQTDKLKIISSQALPAGWTGKLWALEQGVQYAKGLPDPPNYFLFTDADVEHSPDNLKRLVEKAETGHLQMASLMVLLNRKGFWEKLLIPAFVFFFQKLYPFRWVNNPHVRLAAAAGGCILIRRDALVRIGGLQGLKGTIIDDCTLAQAVKQHETKTGFSILNFMFPLKCKSCHPIWLGLTETTRSLRSYPNLSSIWDMVARTAFSQLNFSIVLLGLTLIGMFLVYLMAPAGLVWGIINGNGLIIILSALTWLLMVIAYTPTLKLYRLSPAWGLTLPLVGFLYALMTLDSALRHWRGRGGEWKGRTY